MDARSHAVGRLAERWSGAGVAAGDILLVHSSLKRTALELKRLGLSDPAAIVLESFLAALGGRGALLLPLFNFDFTRGVGFDIRSTPSQMGALTETGRTWPGAVRTGHPIYSFAAIGPEAGAFAGVDNHSGYAEDSPFGLLKRMDGRIAVLDLPDRHSQTFYHHVEETCGADWRYPKAFTGPYTDADGRTAERTYSLYVRDLDRGVATDVDPAGEMMWAEGLYRGDRPGEGSGLRTVSARAMFAFVAGLIDRGEGLGTLYAIGTP